MVSRRFFTLYFLLIPLISTSINYTHAQMEEKKGMKVGLCLYAMKIFGSLLYVHFSIHKYTCVSTCTYVCVFVCVCMCVHTNVYLCFILFISVVSRMCAYAFTYMFTQSTHRRVHKQACI